MGVDLAGARLCDLYLPSKNLTAGRLRATDFSRSVLLFGNFRHADAAGAVLVDADLGGSTLERANLTGASARACCFWVANLSDAILTECDLRGPDLSFAVLRNADLRAADLRGARLSRADLSGADLTGALLDEAQFDDVHFDDVHFDDATRWPSGVRPAEPGPQPPAWVGGTDLSGWLVRRTELRSEGTRTRPTSQ